MKSRHWIQPEVRSPWPACWRTWKEQQPLTTREVSEVTCLRCRRIILKHATKMIDDLQVPAIRQGFERRLKRL